jgi:hypothetical protein
MKRLLQLGFMGALSLLLLGACERQRSVQAEYRDSPAAAAPSAAAPADNAIAGTLRKVDMSHRRFVIGAENGMDQTFTFDVLTAVNGLPQSVSPKSNVSRVRGLIGKEGSELDVQWRSEDGAKLATLVEVTHLRLKN